jgi:hypothetical protein
VCAGSVPKVRPILPFPLMLPYQDNRLRSVLSFPE